MPSMSGEKVEIVWTDYMQFRARLRGFDFTSIEEVVRYSSERYSDTVTGRIIIIGRINDALVMVPCDMDQDKVTPVTIHATTRQQINFRLTTKRFANE
jgi:hypothetical protein